MANGAPQPKPPQAATLPAVSQPVPARPIAKAKPKAKAVAAPKKFAATIYPQTPLPDKFVAAIRELESVLKAPAWMIIQDKPTPGGQPAPRFHDFDECVLSAFLATKAHVPTKPINVVLDSPGGQAKVAFQLSNFFRLHCGGFNVYVPEWAKSAATLFALGASNIYLGKYAELGPLDVQVFDAEREGYGSALDEVQALERLNAFALQAVDAGVLMLLSRSGKSLGTLLPQVLHFVSEMLRPLFEKLDTVHYTQMSRLLKVGEAYAVRQLEQRYGRQRAEEIARQLVNEYPEHGFYIDARELSKIGLKTIIPDADLADAMENLRPAMQDVVAIGQLKEVKP